MSVDNLRYLRALRAIANSSRVLDDIGDAAEFGRRLDQIGDMVDNLRVLKNLPNADLLRALDKVDNLDLSSLRQISRNLDDLATRFPDGLNPDFVRTITDFTRRADDLNDTVRAATAALTTADNVKPPAGWVRGHLGSSVKRWQAYAISGAGFALGLSPYAFLVADGLAGGAYVDWILEQVKDSAVEGFEAVKDAEIEVQRDYISEQMDRVMTYYRVLNPGTISLAAVNQQVRSAMEDPDHTDAERRQNATTAAVTTQLTTGAVGVILKTEFRERLLAEIYPDESEAFRNEELAHGFLRDIVVNSNSSQLSEYGLEITTEDVIETIKSNSDIHSYIGSDLRQGLIAIDPEFATAFANSEINTVLSIGHDRTNNDPNNVPQSIQDEILAAGDSAGLQVDNPFDIELDDLSSEGVSSVFNTITSNMGFMGWIVKGVVGVAGFFGDSAKASVQRFALDMLDVEGRFEDAMAAAQNGNLTAAVDDAFGVGSSRQLIPAMQPILG